MPWGARIQASRDNKIRQVIEAYNQAADKFIAKVESGQARSVETYAELKAARELSREIE